MSELSENLLSPDKGVVIPRIKMSEQGIVGLKQTNGIVYENANRLFCYPQFLRVHDEMVNDQTISQCLLAIKTLIGRVDWTVQAPVGATKQEIERAKFVETCIHDMEHTWGSFITEVLSYIEYGYSIHEKVFRRRLKSNGSKYNDGLVGIRKLPIRSQSTIYKWKFSDDARELLGVEQNLSNLSGVRAGALLARNGSIIEIPRNKFLHFLCDSTKENPEGNSLLKGAYTAYKRLDLLNNQLMIGVARDLGGIPVFSIPAKYLDPNASPEDKAVATAFQTIASNLTTGAQGSVVIPMVIDPDSKQPIFKLELLESKGGRSFDVPAIIKQLQDDVRNSMLCSVLGFTGNTSNNWSIDGGGTELLSLHLSYRLKEIASVLNEDLIRSLYEANGWNTDNLPKFVFSDFDEMASEDFSKMVQRFASVGMLEQDREVFNIVRRRMGVEEKPSDEPIDKDNIVGVDSKSRSGDGFKSPTGDGTAKSVRGKDNSSNNLDNSA